MSLNVGDKVLIKGIVHGLSPLSIQMGTMTPVTGATIAAQGSHPAVKSTTTPGTFSGIATDVSTYDDPSAPSETPLEPVIIIVD